MGMIRQGEYMLSMMGKISTHAETAVVACGSVPGFKPVLILL